MTSSTKVKTNQWLERFECLYLKLILKIASAGLLLLGNTFSFLGILYLFEYFPSVSIFNQLIG